jgi:hypothetical protein
MAPDTAVNQSKIRKPPVRRVKFDPTKFAGPTEKPKKPSPPADHYYVKFRGQDLKLPISAKRK